MDMLRRFLLGAVLTVCCAAASSFGKVMEPRDILEKALSKLEEIDCVSYALDSRTFPTQEDSLYIEHRHFLNREYRNPTDTFGLVKFITLKSDSAFYSSFDGRDDLFYYKGYTEDCVEKSDISRQTVMMVESPFFNKATRLCEFLLTTDFPVELTVEDRNDKWRIDAAVEGGRQIIVLGKPRQAEWSPDGVVTQFGLEIDKTSYLPDFLSFNQSYPQERVEWRVSDVRINKPGEGFDLELKAYLPDVPVFRDNGSEIGNFMKGQFDKFKASLASSPLQTDSLELVDGGKVSLMDSEGKVRLIALLSLRCAYTHMMLPILNKIREKFSDDDLMMLGVVLQSDAQMEALRRFKNTNGIEFDLARNNGQFYRYYSSMELSPVIIIISPEGELAGYINGYGDSMYDVVVNAIEEILREGVD